MLEKLKEHIEHAVDMLRTQAEHRAPVADVLESLHEFADEIETRVAQLEAKAKAELVHVAAVVAAPLTDAPYAQTPAL